MTEENVKVAVRVRPFNSRETGRNAKCIIEMNGQNTTIKDPNSGEVKKFAFDHSYWSHDGCSEDADGYFSPDPSHKNGSKFADQKKVFSDLGQGILDNCWNGYNSTIFAYGQTGSGKSWSIIGYGPNKGIVPMFCEELFKGIEAKKAAKEEIEYEVKFSMMEIYNEVVRDLLNSSGNAKKGLKIREHPKKGFYAENLKQVLVTSYEDINQRMEEGTVNRTIASTNMNATSSRAHTIVGITFLQKFKNAAGEDTTKSSVVNLVDLAGSERVESTGATGARLKEGAAINMSLSALGNCIHALAENSAGKKVKVPFRDSSLTKLLMNALGGNSRTLMIAALSPADINYDETLSTLRYADRAKQIKTNATINEDPTEKLLRELKEENERLKQMMAGGGAVMAGVNTKGMSAEDKKKIEEELKEQYEAQMAENNRELEEMKKTYEEKLKAAETSTGSVSMAQRDKDRQTKVHIYNINMDPQLTGHVVNFIEPGKHDVGNQKGTPSDFIMQGPGITEHHAIFEYDQKSNKVTLTPTSPENRVMVNGDQIKSTTQLNHNDRLVFGTTQIWAYQNPAEAAKSNQKFPSITYEYCQQEIAAKAGIDMSNADNSADMALLQQDLMDTMPAVEEANAISEELDKKVKFEIMLVSPQMLGKEGLNTENTAGQVCVKMRNLENGAEFVWPKEKFLDRLYQMKEMYHNYEDEDDWDVDDASDPFKEDLNSEVTIGTVNVYLQPIAHMVDLKEQLDITDYRGKLGLMNVEVIPCDKTGKEFKEEDDVFVDNPDQLMGKDVSFKIKILNCRGLPNKFTDIYCKYRLYLDEKENKTGVASDTTNPDFNDEKTFHYKKVTKQFCDYLRDGCVTVHVMGKQRIRKSAMVNRQGMTTRDLLKGDKTVFSKTGHLMNGFQMDGRVVDPQKQSIIVELLLLKKQEAKYRQHVDSVKKLLDEAESQGRRRVSLEVVRGVLMAPSQEMADEIISRLPEEDNIDDDFAIGRVVDINRNTKKKKPAKTNESGSSVCSLL